MRSDTHMTQTGTVIGTPSYMSPEQAQGHDLSGQSDLYSVGVIAYQYITGELPYQADSSITVAIKHISDPIPTLPAPFQALQAFVNRVLAKAPEDRFPSGTSLVGELNKALAFLTPTTVTEGTTLVVLPKDLSGADFETHTLANPKVASLEASELDETLVTKPDEGSRRNFSNSPAISGASNDTSTSSLTKFQATMKFIFVQINQIRVSFFPDGKSRSVIGLVAVALIAIILGGAYFLKDSSASSALSDSDRILIAQLLVAATKDREAEKFFSPVGDNALEKYRAILELDPGNDLALNGLEAIGSILVKKAETAIDSGQLGEANKILEMTRFLVGDSESASELNNRLRLAEAQAADTVKEALAQARFLQESGQHVQAIDAYQKLAALDGSSQIALGELKELAEKNLREAEILNTAGQLKSSREKLEIANRASESLADLDLANRISDLDKELDIKSKKSLMQTQLSDLLSNAETAIDNQRYSLPSENNAYYFFNQALVIDPENSTAKEGIQRVFSYLEAGRRGSTKAG